jgi:anti-sigma factor RsiW
MDFKAVRRCERAREYASLALDDELSQFEHALLRAHLEQCDGCRSYQVGLVVTTDRLRNASLERLSRPVALPRRQRVSFRGVQVGLVAALVVVAVGLGGILSSLGSESVRPNVSLPKAGESQEMQDIRRERLQEIGFRPSAPGGLGVVDTI